MKNYLLELMFIMDERQLVCYPTNDTCSLGNSVSAVTF